jgi:hypothetical protein
VTEKLPSNLPKILEEIRATSSPRNGFAVVAGARFARISKDGRDSMRCGHPSRCLLRKLLVLDIPASLVAFPQGTARSARPPGSGQSIVGSFAPQSAGLFLSKITIGSSSGPDG